MEDFLFPIIICGILFIGLPWIIFHYITKWKTAATLTTEDENLLDELHDLARRLEAPLSAPATPNESPSPSEESEDAR